MSNQNLVSRRRMLQTSAAVAATAGLAGFPTIIPSSALGADGAVAPSNRLTMGFIGIGKQASGHLNFMAGKTDVQVVAVCDVDKTRRELAKSVVDNKNKDLGRKDAKAVDQYVDFRELLARKD